MHMKACISMCDGFFVILEKCISNKRRGISMFSFEVDILIVIERLILAAVLGGLIGWEREQRNKQAGVKTHLLVSLGSSLIMLLSIYGFSDMVNHPNARFDPARLAAQVISGIGFLGAGAILRHSNRIVTGITTAATLWVVAAIGLSVGAGFYLPAIITTIIVLVNVILLRGLGHKFIKSKKEKELQIVVWNVTDQLADIIKILDEEKVEIRNISMSDESSDEEEMVSIQLHIRVLDQNLMIKVVNRIKGVQGVKEVMYI